MAIHVACNECFEEYKVRDEAAGKSIRCRNCQAVIRVPRSGEGGDGELIGAREVPRRQRAKTSRPAGAKRLAALLPMSGALLLHAGVGGVILLLLALALVSPTFITPFLRLTLLAFIGYLLAGTGMVIVLELRNGGSGVMKIVTWTAISLPVLVLFMLLWRIDFNVRLFFERLSDPAARSIVFEALGWLFLIGAALGFFGGVYALSFIRVVLTRKKELTSAWHVLLMAAGLFAVNAAFRPVLTGKQNDLRHQAIRAEHERMKQEHFPQYRSRSSADPASAPAATPGADFGPAPPHQFMRPGHGFFHQAGGPDGAVVRIENFPWARRNEVNAVLTDLPGVTHRSFSVVNGTAVIRLSPIDDLDDLASRLTFGKVTEIDREGRTLKVVLSDTD